MSRPFLHILVPMVLRFCPKIFITSSILDISFGSILKLMKTIHNKLTWRDDDLNNVIIPWDNQMQDTQVPLHTSHVCERQGWPISGQYWQGLTNQRRLFLSDEAVMNCHDAENGKNRYRSSASHDLLINGQHCLTNEGPGGETLTNQTPGHVIHWSYLISSSDKKHLPLFR